MSANTANTARPLPADSPVRYGCYLGLLLATITLLYVVYMLIAGTHRMIPYQVAFAAGGIVEAVTCWYALQGSRAAWSYATALNGILAGAFIFGAPSVRDAWDVPLLVGFVPSAILACTTALLSWSPDRS